MWGSRETAENKRTFHAMPDPVLNSQSCSSLPENTLYIYLPSCVSNFQSYCIREVYLSSALTCVSQTLLSVFPSFVFIILSITDLVLPSWLLVSFSIACTFNIFILHYNLNSFKAWDRMVNKGVNKLNSQVILFDHYIIKLT